MKCILTFTISFIALTSCNYNCSRVDPLQIKDAYEQSHCPIHDGINNTISRCALVGYCWGIGKVITAMVKGCEQCMAKRGVPEKVRVPLQPIIVERKMIMVLVLSLFSQAHTIQWCYDLAKVSEDTLTGHQHVLSVIDMHSKFAWHFPMMTQTADEVGLYLMHLCLVEGRPLKGLTDNGKHFTSVEAIRTLTSMGLLIAHGLPYTPTTQGADERLHQTVANAVCVLCRETRVVLTDGKLRAIAKSGNGSWAHAVELVTHQYNTRPHSSIGMTPYEAHRAEEPRPLGHTGGSIVLDPSVAFESQRQRASDIQRQVHAKLIERGIVMQKQHASRYRINFKEHNNGVVVRIKAEAPHEVHPWRCMGVIVQCYPDQYSYDVRLLTHGYGNDERPGTVLTKVPHRRLILLCGSLQEAQERRLLPDHRPQHDAASDSEELPESTSQHAAAQEQLIWDVEVVAGKQPDPDYGFVYWVKWKQYPWTASTWEPRCVLVHVDTGNLSMSEATSVRMCKTSYHTSH